MTGPTREEVERLAAAFRKATFSKGRTVGGICGQTIDAMMASTMHEVSALNLEQGACALETLAAENAALRERLDAAEAERDEAKEDAGFYDDDSMKHRRRCEYLESQLTEARAREATAETRGWNAAIEAAAGVAAQGHHPRSIRALRRNTEGMMRDRIIVGPESMLVERNGFRSVVRQIGAHDDTAEIKRIAAELSNTIRPFVAWAAWLTHRLRMARQRRLVAYVAATWPGDYHPGPRPDLIARQPWKHAAYGDWTMLPHGVVARLLRRNTEGNQ